MRLRLIALAPLRFALRPILAAVLCAGLLLGTPSTAPAQSPTEAGYGETVIPPGQEAPSREVAEGDPNPAPASAAGPRPARAPAAPAKLPFSGADVGILTLAALALLTTGMVLRRSTRVEPG